MEINEWITYKGIFLKHDLEIEKLNYKEAKIIQSQRMIAVMEYIINQRNKKIDLTNKKTRRN